MRYCTNCGNKLEGADNFCASCGQPIKERMDKTDENGYFKEKQTDPPINKEGTRGKEQTTQHTLDEEISFMDKIKHELFMTVEEDPDKWSIDQNNARVLHIISWVSFVLALLTIFELIASLIGYLLARTAMKSGINANAARWANLLLTVFYLFIFILFFILALIGAL